MNKKINKNLIFLGALVVFLGFSQVADAAYVCDQYMGPGTNRIVTNCWNSQTPNNYSNSGGLGDSSNSNSGFGDPIAYTYAGNVPAYNGNNPSNTYGNNGYSNNNATNTTNTSNGVSTNNTNTTRTVARTNNTTTNKVATNTNTKTTDNNTNNSTNNVAGTTNVSNDEESNLSANSLSALSLQGSDSFLPDTVWEWICVFFLILVIIILIRQFKSKPSHEVHNVAHH